MAVRAPDFSPDLEWVNTAGRPLGLADFRGRVLVLDFWTYGCINCMHMIPELRELERAFGDEVVVVGVHSGKHPNERDTANIQRACERLGVDHPVVNDRQFRLWREYAVSAWPTLVVVSPTGYVLGTHAGEVQATELAPFIAGVLDQARPRGELDSSTPIPHSVDSRLPGPGVLRFPAKVTTMADGRVMVSDTGHHRVLELAADPATGTARITRVIGSGEPGDQNGKPERARFRSPHGLAAVGHTLYVADTGNHLIRCVDTRTGKVSTAAGTGYQARRRVAGGPPCETPLNSPWDLLWWDEALHVAMAGPHQLWRVIPRAEFAEPWIGSGTEGLHDGSRRQAALAQPSGLATDGTRIFWADAEASAIRSDDPGDDTITIVGTGLFDFGDQDGVGDAARLQHPLGVTWWPERRTLLVADSYNHRIKTVDPATREAGSFVGAGEPGLEDGAPDQARFWEPGGVALSPDGRHLWVADTNNHALRVVELDSGTTRTVEISQ